MSYLASLGWLFSGFTWYILHLLSLRFVGSVREWPYPIALVESAIDFG